MSDERLSYRVKEIPAVTGMGMSTVYRDIQSGKLRAFKNGTATIVLRDDLLSWLRGEPVTAEQMAANLAQLEEPRRFIPRNGFAKKIRADYGVLDSEFDA